MGAGRAERPARPSRLLAVTFYLGLAPVLAVLRLHRRNPFFQHHYAQAVTIVGLLAYIFLVGLLGFGAGAYIIVSHEQVWKTYALEAIGDAFFGVLLLLWALAWLLAVVLTLKGSFRPVPLLWRLTSGRWMFRAALVGNIGLGLVVITVGALTLHALAITHADARPAPVYMLYDSGGAPVPRCVFALGFYRIALASQARWGPGSVAVAPLTEENLHMAMRQGRFIFLASHGSNGAVTTPLLEVVPDERRPASCLWSISKASADDPVYWKDRQVQVGGDIQFVYVTACGSGEKEEFWRAALAPAEVRTFPRTSAVGQHIVWMWMDGPRRIQAIK